MEKIIPIDDLNKDELSSEDKLRLKLAAMYRLVDLKGWGQNIYNHITVSSALDQWSVVLEVVMISNLSVFFSATMRGQSKPVPHKPVHAPLLGGNGVQLGQN